MNLFKLQKVCGEPEEEEEWSEGRDLGAVSSNGLAMPAESGLDSIQPESADGDGTPHPKSFRQARLNESRPSGEHPQTALGSIQSIVNRCATCRDPTR